MVASSYDPYFFGSGIIVITSKKAVDPFLKPNHITFTGEILKTRVDAIDAAVPTHYPIACGP
jgi:hypothetical protein